MIESLPDNIDLTQDYLAKCWTEKLGVSRVRLECAIAAVGSNGKKVEKYLEEGFRIAIRDSAGTGRQILRITLQNDGFAALVPYHPAKNGWIYELPLDYSKSEFVVPLSTGKHFTVSDVAKLSFHMNGFVQFSTGGGTKIVSGYNPILNQAKGAGLCAPDPVDVTTGPLFGVQAYTIEDFDACGSKPVEMFEEKDLWRRVGETTENDIAFHVEVFMLPRRMLVGCFVIDGKRILRRRLPYQSEIWFKHDLRVLEFAHLPFFLGVIVSRIPGDKECVSGYKLNGPSCGGPGEQKKCIAAQYPCPEMVSTLNPKSLDYRGPESGAAVPPSA